MQLRRIIGSDEDGKEIKDSDTRVKVIRQID